MATWEHATGQLFAGDPAGDRGELPPFEQARYDRRKAEAAASAHNAPLFAAATETAPGVYLPPAPLVPPPAPDDHP